MTHKFRSKNEQVTHSALTRLYPNCVIEHDYYIGDGLYVDFLVRSTFKIGIEVDGEQHYAFNSYFHETLEDFGRQQDRDDAKNRLCEDLGITLLRLDARGGITSLEAMEQVVECLRDIEYVETGQLKELDKKRKDARRRWNQEQYRRYKTWQKTKAR
jgi:hypothetical protein